jgi:hypothetical protein
VKIAKTYFLAVLAFGFVDGIFYLLNDLPGYAKSAGLIDFLSNFFARIIAVIIWYRYLCHSRRVLATYPDAGARPFGWKPIQVPAKPAEGEPYDYREERNFAALFNFKQGINYYVGIGYFGSWLIFTLVYNMISIIRTGDLSYEWDFFLFNFVHVALGAVLFVTLIHLIHSQWLLIPLWGFVSPIITIVVWTARAFITSGHFHFPFRPLQTLLFFMESILFIGLLVLAVYIFRIRLWNLLAANILSYILIRLVAWIFFPIIYGAETYSFQVIDILYNMIYGALFGLALYLAIVLFYKQKRPLPVQS